MRETRWAFLLVLLAGCGSVGSDSLNPLPPTSYQPIDGSIAPGLRDAAADRRRTSDGVAPIDGGGPQAEVSIVVLAPVEGTVLKASSSPEVRARVTAAMPIDAGPLADQIDLVTYAFILADDPKGKRLVSGPLFGPAANSEFATRTDLTTLATGSYLLTVTAVTHNGGTATAAIAVQVDAGPTIRIISPKSGGAYKGSVAVQVQIDSAPFLPTTLPIEAAVGAYPIELAASGPAGFYEGIIEFEKYNPPLVDEQRLIVGATNSLGTRNQAEVKFVVDVRGPTFTDTLPLPGAVVGGVIIVRAKITDASGILGPSVIAIIEDKVNDVSFKLELKPEAGATGYYSALFDTAKIQRCRVRTAVDELCVVLPNLSFRASDILGNDAFLAYDFAVDHIPPIFDLDPPNDLRLMKFEKKLRKDVCSWAFDPLGNSSRPGDMPNQGSMVPQVFDLRARIEDDGNHAVDLKFSPTSGIDETTTHMYVLDDTSQVLVVDWDGDGICDGINPLLVPTTTPPKSSREVMTVRLVPVPPTGSGDFTPDPSLSETVGCPPGIDLEAPTRLCAGQNVPIAIGYPTALDPQSAIWGIDPLTEGEPWCMGGQFDTYANQIAEGWTCFAAAGKDRNGNPGVSAPLRVFVSYKLNAELDGIPRFGPNGLLPPDSAGPAPDCTGRYDPLTKALSAVPCQARVFPRGEIRWQGGTTGTEGAGAGN